MIKLGCVLHFESISGPPSEIGSYTLTAKAIQIYLE